MKHFIIDSFTEKRTFIENAPINEVINLAKKEYNIFIKTQASFYNLVCQMIRDRLDREGLSYDIVRPE